MPLMRVLPFIPFIGGRPENLYLLVSVLSLGKFSVFGASVFFFGRLHGGVTYAINAGFAF